MTLKIEPAAREYILGKGGVCSIRAVAVKNCCGGVPLPEIAFAPPRSGVNMLALSQDGVTVHLSRTLVFQEDVVEIRLNKILFFRELELPTLKLLS